MRGRWIRQSEASAKTEGVPLPRRASLVDDKRAALQRHPLRLATIAQRFLHHAAGSTPPPHAFRSQGRKELGALNEILAGIYSATRITKTLVCP
jgi:hypothetical protein